MVEESRKGADVGRRDRSTEGFAATIARKAVEPVAAAAVTAGAAYLTRKSSLVWREKLAPKIREQGGARALAQSTSKRVSEMLEERASTTISAVSRRIGDVRARYGAVPGTVLHATPKGRREKERAERQRRRKERQRALQRSGSS